MATFYGRLPTLNINVITEATIQEVSDKGLVYSDKEGKRAVAEGTKVVLARGSQSERSLAEALRGKVAELHVIGDSTKPALIMEATYDGSRIGRLI
jgi:hypothetical protein